MWARLRQRTAQLKRDALAAWFLVRHENTPRWLKWLGVFIVAYALSPIDLIPDFLPLIGYVDELILLPALLWVLIHFAPPAVLATCREQADAMLASKKEKPRSMLGAAIIILIWLTIAWWLLALFGTSLGIEPIPR